MADITRINYLKRQRTGAVHTEDIRRGSEGDRNPMLYRLILGHYPSLMLDALLDGIQRLNRLHLQTGRARGRGCQHG
jgi:hypothetical protein